MAKTILASSLDNLIMINTSSPIVLPFVTFTIGNNFSGDVNITIRNADDVSGFYKVIQGTSGGNTTSNTFNTSGKVLYGLLECLKLNNIFFNIIVESANTIKAQIDSSIRYSIVCDNDGIQIGGNYSSYSPSMPNKTVLMMQGLLDNVTNISMEKYHNDSIVSFNLTSPFQKTTFKNPLSFNLIGYEVVEGTPRDITVPYNSVTVMPTTLHKFQGVNYNKYYYTGTTKVDFLTTQTSRYYNYNEWVGLSVLSDVAVMLKKDYYTNSGVFLETELTTQYVEKNGIRYDIYDNFDLNDVEATHDKQVGYILVYGVKADTKEEITNPIRFDIMPHCEGNNEIFFLNEIGGIDSFNFTNEKIISRSINDTKTYNITHTRPYVEKYEHEYVQTKVNKISTTLTTNQVNSGIAEWLNQLVKSKYVFKFLGLINPRYMMIVVDKFDIETSTNNEEFELELVYHSADNEITY